MTNQVIPAQAVEAAARVLYSPQPLFDEVTEEFTGHRPWEWLTAEYQESLRQDARAALEAAAPHMLNLAKREAWDANLEVQRLRTELAATQAVIEVDASLDLLANGAVVLDDEGDAWQKFFDGWKVSGGLSEFERPTLPARIIHSPLAVAGRATK